MTHDYVPAAGMAATAGTLLAAWLTLARKGPHEPA
jgi:hypothetical protein